MHRSILNFPTREQCYLRARNLQQLRHVHIQSLLAEVYPCSHPHQHIPPTREILPSICRDMAKAHPALVDGYLPFAHFFLHPYALPTI